MGTQRHYWQASKKKEGSSAKVAKFILRLYPHLKSDEVELMASLNDVKALRAHAKLLGMSDADIKKELG